jgi:hypothetical protein
LEGGRPTAAALTVRENRRDITVIATFIVMSDFAGVKGANERKMMMDTKLQSTKTWALIH